MENVYENKITYNLGYIDTIKFHAILRSPISDYINIFTGKCLRYYILLHLIHYLKSRNSK